MTWLDVEKQLNNNKRDIVFISSPMGKSFYVNDYSTVGFFKTLFSGLDIWNNAYWNGTPKLFNDKFEYRTFELDIDLYPMFKIPSVKRMFAKHNVALILEEDLTV